MTRVIASAADNVELDKQGRILIPAKLREKIGLGKEVVLADNTSVSAYLEACRYKTDRIVVELNEEILPKDRYAETILKDGDCMEIVTFVGGG